MHLQPDLPKNTTVLSTSQSQPGSGSFVDKLPSADWTNDIIAFLALLFTVITFAYQQWQNRVALAEQREKDRLATAEQNEKDRVARLEVEKLRQQTIRLEWYRDIVRERLSFVHQKFDTLHHFKDDIRTPDLPEEEKDRLSKAYKSTLAELRGDFLERILFVHVPTYDALKDKLDDLADEVVTAIFNDELKLSHDGVYEREIGSKIGNCQREFFKVLYNYRGEE